MKSGPDDEKQEQNGKERETRKNSDKNINEHDKRTPEQKMPRVSCRTRPHSYLDNCEQIQMHYVYAPLI